jgi:uncharacterized protein YdaL
MRLVNAFRLTVVVFCCFSPSAVRADCVNVLYDDVGTGDHASINAIFLANLLGHWPQYEVRVKPVFNYVSGETESCKATVYLGTSTNTQVPSAFLSDFFTTKHRVAWVGFGAQKLDPAEFGKSFGFRVAGELGVSGDKTAEPGFYQTVSYKASTFTKGLYKEPGGAQVAAFAAEDFEPMQGRLDSAGAVLAELIHNKTGDKKPYILRRENRFVVGDIPFSYIHTADRYFVFADLLFDILDEKPHRDRKLAFIRLEDIHNRFATDLLASTFQSLRDLNTPISIAYIPLFADPQNAMGFGNIKTPEPPTEGSALQEMVDGLGTDRNNTVIWHGVTHQFGSGKNPFSGASGDDYEFWDANHQRPVSGDSPQYVLDRLKVGLQAIEGSYKVSPRFWITPHYQCSALDNVVFGKVFPWVVGRVAYYPTSRPRDFTLPATSQSAALNWPAVSKDRLEQLKGSDWQGIDRASRDGLLQIFPYEIYRDIYGQRIIPETLDYLSLGQNQGSTVREVPQILADAQRNLVVRDYWASLYVHPFLFNIKSEGGGGEFRGDTTRLKNLISGLRGLGYQFTSLPEFEHSLKAPSPQAEATDQVSPNGSH